MAFYQGSIVSSSAIDKIVTLLTTPPQGSVDAYWTKVGSGSYDNEGFILFSKGKTGNERLFIRIKQATGVYYGITFSMIEDYQPNAVQGLNGVATNESVSQLTYWANGNSYPSTAPISYWLSFDRDKIMLATTGDKTISTGLKGFIYIGLPERMYTPTANPPVPAMAMAVSRIGTPTNGAVGDASQSTCLGLRDRGLNLAPKYTMVSLSKWKSMGWGGNILLGDIFMYHNSDEGLRVKMAGVHPLVTGTPIEYRDGDEITVGSKRYTIHNVWNAGQGTVANCFPTGWLAVEQIQ